MTRAIPALVVATVALAAVGSAHAQPRPSGALAAGPLLRGADVGLSSLVDLWYRAGVVHVGGAMGVGAVTSDDDDETRIFMPVGVSAAIVLAGERAGGSLRARLGTWAGATNQGIRAGLWVAVGAHFEYALDAHVALAAGLDLWLLFAHGDATLLSPGVGLRWSFDGE